MQFVAAAGGGLISLLWIFGALSGRLASMIAAVVQPSWINGQSGSDSGNSGSSTARPAEGHQGIIPA